MQSTTLFASHWFESRRWSFLPSTVSVKVCLNDHTVVKFYMSELRNLLIVLCVNMTKVPRIRIELQKAKAPANVKVHQQLTTVGAFSSHRSKSIPRYRVHLKRTIHSFVQAATNTTIALNNLVRAQQRVRLKKPSIGKYLLVADLLMEQLVLGRKKHSAAGQPTTYNQYLNLNKAGSN